MTDVGVRAGLAVVASVAGAWLATTLAAPGAGGRAAAARSGLASLEAQASQPPSPAADGGRIGPPTASGPVRVEMRNVHMHVTPDVILEIKSLRGTLVKTERAAFPVFDDRESYVVHIDTAEIAMSTTSLSALMNNYVLAYHKAPLSDVEVKVREGRIEQKGRLKKGISVPIKVKATAEATEDGRIRLRPQSVKAASLPVRSLMHTFGIEMDDVIKIEPGRGLAVEDDDILLDPEELLPPPRIRGRVTAVRLEGDRVVQTFGHAEPGPPRPLSAAAKAPNHMYFLGGQLRFGKLVMDGADLELIDQDPSDPFDFDLEHYNDMLVAGYSKNTPAHGLRTHMPDYADLKQRRAARPSRP